MAVVGIERLVTRNERFLAALGMNGCVKWICGSSIPDVRAGMGHNMLRLYEQNAEKRREG